MDEFAAGFMAGQGDRNDNNGGWGDGWMGLIAFAIIFGGWGGGGWGGFGGGYGGGGAYPVEAILQRSLDTQTIIGKLDGLNSGVCSLGYDQLAQMNSLGMNVMQGFHGMDNAVCTLGYQTQQGFNNANVVALQNQNALQNQISQCCCDNKAALAQMKYDMATSDCSIKTLVNQLAQQLMWGQQNGLRDLTDLINNKFCQLEMSQKDAVIADLRAQLAQCGNQNMANAIVSRLTAVINPPAVPAYPAANPNGFGNWAPQVLNGGGYSYNNSCGCNSGCNSGCGF